MRNILVKHFSSGNWSGGGEEMLRSECVNVFLEILADNMETNLI
jgi:hypothetical protein